MLAKEIAPLRAEIEALRARVAELESSRKANRRGAMTSLSEAMHAVEATLDAAFARSADTLRGLGATEEEVEAEAALVLEELAVFHAFARWLLADAAGH